MCGEKQTWLNTRFDYPEWDYKHSINIEKYADKYLLLMKGKLTYNRLDKENAEQWLDLAYLDRGSLYDLFWNLCEKLDLAEKQDDLNELYHRGKIE